jgi:hypothetical protein
VVAVVDGITSPKIVVLAVVVLVDTAQAQAHQAEAHLPRQALLLQPQPTTP